ncbi:lysis protein [Pantoea sp. ACRSB]|uniref:lysis protein n=1 Tax=Pantoea sp. ACRSB TaxID=2918207 RepID=UPI002892E2D1|nr:lysis protein [Pantoea sp. ACRSB]MCG7387414.1 lysis protein [Pantoea sp. ACRSB]
MTFSWRALIFGLLLVALIVVCRVAILYHRKYVTADSLATERQQTIDDMQVRQRDVAALGAKYTKQLADAKDTISDLRRDVDSGKRRVQLNAICEKQPTSTGSVGDATTARLNDSAQRDYFTLRERISTISGQVSYLQQYIKEQCLR